MERLEVNGGLYLVKRKFPAERVKDMELLSSLKHFYNADTVIKGGNPNTVYLCQKVDEAVLVDEVVVEPVIVDGFLFDEREYEVG
jgi:hypothetical protein